MEIEILQNNNFESVKLLEIRKGSISDLNLLTREQKDFIFNSRIFGFNMDEDELENDLQFSDFCVYRLQIAGKQIIKGYSVIHPDFSVQGCTKVEDSDSEWEGYSSGNLPPWYKQLQKNGSDCLWIQEELRDILMRMAKEDPRRKVQICDWLN